MLVKLALSRFVKARIELYPTGKVKKPFFRQKIENDFFLRERKAREEETFKQLTYSIANLLTTI